MDSDLVVSLSAFAAAAEAIAAGSSLPTESGSWDHRARARLESAGSNGMALCFQGMAFSMCGGDVSVVTSRLPSSASLYTMKMMSR